MNKDNFFRLNLNSYKAHLSPFGRNVLDTLIRHWRTGYNNAGCRGRQQLKDSKSNENHSESHSSSRHVSYSPPPVRTTYNGGKDDYDEYEMNNDNCLLPPTSGYKSKRGKKQTLCFRNEPEVQLNPYHSHNIPQDSPAITVPSSNELVKAVQVAIADDDEILTANDMITPVINFADKQNKNLLTSKKIYDNTTDIQARTFLEIFNNDNNNVQIDISIDKALKTKDDNIDGPDVNWGDIFDTELFQDLNSPKRTKVTEIQNNQSDLIIRNSSDAAKLEKVIEKNKTVNVTATKKSSNKRNLDQTHVTKKTTKKVKKATNKEKDTEKESKNNFRKIKYSKAVTNWLNDVNPNMQTEDSPEKKMDNKDKAENLPTASTSNTTTKQIKSDDNIIALSIELPSIFMDKKPKEKAKKVVQATLAQKDGKMKFKLPIKDQTENKPELTDKEIKIKDAVKEKKAKTKFIAPIKSQIPVKSVEFDVCTVDESNIPRINSIIDTDSDNTEVLMILVYSNGFCQLNNEHTEDTCVPEGILVQLNDIYYYFKGDNAAYGEIIKKLIEKFHVICYNGKRLLIHLIVYFSMELEQHAFNISDAKIGGCLIDPDSPPENFGELQKLITFNPEYTIATDCMLQKAAWYSTLLKECFAKLKALLIENSSFFPSLSLVV